MFGLNDLDVFGVLYVLDDLDFLDILDVLDVLDILDDVLDVLEILDDLDVLDLLDLLDLAKVCSEKISLIELHCRNVKLIFHSPYIWADMLRSYKLMDGYGMGWKSLCGAIL